MDPAGTILSIDAALAERELDVPSDREVRVEGVGLEDHRDVGSFERRRSHRTPDRDRPLGDLLQARHHPQRGGLAAPRGPEEHEQLAVGDVQTERVDHGDLPVAFGDLRKDDVAHSDRPLVVLAAARAVGRHDRVPPVAPRSAATTCSGSSVVSTQRPNSPSANSMTTPGPRPCTAAKSFPNEPRRVPTTIPRETGARRPNAPQLGHAVGHGAHLAHGRQRGVNRAVEALDLLEPREGEGDHPVAGLDGGHVATVACSPFATRTERGGTNTEKTSRVPDHAPWPPAPGGTWVLDLDGVVWLTGEPIPGAPEAIATLRNAQNRVLFATNNSAPTQAEMLARFDRAGIPAEADELVTSVQALAGMIESGSAAMVLGERGVLEALGQRGVSIVTSVRSTR